MKLEIKADVLKKYIKKMSSLVLNFTALPHESGIYIEADDTKIIFRSRNQYASLKIESTKIENFRILEKGKILVKAKTLNDIVSKMTGDEIGLNKIDENILYIKSNDSQYEINLLNINNYNIEEIMYVDEKGKDFKINSSIFKKSLLKVMNAVPENHQRRILQGINANLKNKTLYLTSTNGQRIHRSMIKIDDCLPFNATLNIKGVKEMQKIISDDSIIKVKFEKSYVFIENDELIIKSKLIEGAYPDVSKPFDYKYEQMLEISKEEFVKLLDRTTILTQNIDTGITRLLINNGELKLESREIEIGYSNVITTDFKFSDDKLFEIFFSPKYMAEAIKSIEAKELFISFEGCDKPIKIWHSNELFEAIVLPYKTNA